MKRILSLILCLLAAASTAQAQFASVGTIITASNNTSSSSWSPTTSATLEAGNVGVCVVAIDNISTTDGNTNNITGVTDAAGNTWVKGLEQTNGQGSAAAGATVAIFYTKATTQLNSAAAITVTLSSNATAKALKCAEFTVGANPLTTDGTTQEVQDATDPGSITATGVLNVEHLWVRGIALETTNTSSTATGGWTRMNPTASSGGIAVYGEFKIATGTSSGASDPTYQAVDNASVLIGIVEDVAVPTPTPTATPTVTATPTATNIPQSQSLPMMGVG